MIRFIGCVLLFYTVINAESVFFSIKKGNKRYETMHVYIDVKCLSRSLSVSIRFKKPLDKDTLKAQSKKIRYKGKKPMCIEFPKGQIIASNKNQANYVLHGQLSMNHRKIHLVLNKGVCKFSYKNEVVFFHYFPDKQGIEFPKRVMINMAIVFYKNQKEIPRTAVTPGASQ